MRKVLFICHDAERTGAPILLLNLLRWFRDHQCLNFEILIRRGGSLNQAFEQLGNVTFYEVPPMPRTDTSSPSARTKVRNGLERLGLMQPWTKERWEAAVRNKTIRRLNAKRFDAIYSNTIINGEVLEWLSVLNVPVITHVHELEDVITRYGDRNWRQVTAYTTQFIAASHAVGDNLYTKHGIELSRIEIVHGFIPVSKIECNETIRARMRASLDIPHDAFLICGSGIDSWRKGTDLFVRLAGSIEAERPSRPTYFVWVGGWITRQEQLEIETLALECGVQDRLRFVGQVENPHDYFCAADVFAMVSREDPFPLVCLESAATGCPILCFADAGGMPEFVENDAGFIVPYLDVGCMAKKVLLLQTDPQLHKQLGTRAREKVYERHDIQSNAAKILEVIERVVW